MYSSDVESFESRKLCRQIRSASKKSDLSTGEHVHLEQLGAVNSDPCPLANDFGGENKVLEDLLVDAGESTAARPLLLDAGRTGGLAQHPSLRYEDNMAVGELLLKFPGESEPQSLCEPNRNGHLHA